MKKPNFELGPLQKQWIADLRAYPKRQHAHSLGFKKRNGHLSLCCLGQALISMGAGEWVGNMLYSGASLGILCPNDLKKLGLTKPASQHLARLNDCDTPWTEIAGLLETFPEDYFFTSK